MTTKEAPHKRTWLPTGTILEERWVLEEPLGQGGFATVYKARHLKLERPAAVKVLELQAAPHELDVFNQRFLREAKLAASLEHPNVIQILDYGLCERHGAQKPFIVMELLRGHDLEHELIEHGPLTHQRAEALFAGALDALAASHALGIIHRDLKPSNLFLCQPGTARERLVVLDFGIARVWDDPDSKLTATSHFTGTPAYLAPEYIQEQRVSPALDVYQMGLIIAESLSGAPVVQASAPLGYLMAHCNGEQRLAAELEGTQLGEELRRAIQVDPGARHHDAAALRDALANIDWSIDATAVTLTPTLPDTPLSEDFLPPVNQLAATIDAPVMDTTTRDLPATDHATPDAPTTATLARDVPDEAPATHTPQPAPPSAPQHAQRDMAPLLVAMLLVGAALGGGVVWLQGNSSAHQEPTAPPVTRASEDIEPTKPGEPPPETPAAAPDVTGAEQAVTAPPPRPPRTPPSQQTADVPATSAPTLAKATAPTVVKKPAAKKVAIAEDVELLLVEPIDKKLGLAHGAYRIVAIDVDRTMQTYLRGLDEYGIDQPHRASGAFAEFHRDWRRSASRLTDAAKHAPANARLDAASTSLAASMRELADLAQESNTFRDKLHGEAQPAKGSPEHAALVKELEALDARWRELTARFTPRRAEFIAALHELEQETISARASRADKKTSPVLHHFHALLLHSSKAMQAAEGDDALTEVGPHIKTLKTHRAAFDALDVNSLQPALTSNQCYALKSWVNGSKNVPKKLAAIKKARTTGLASATERDRKITSARHYAYMNYGFMMRKYFDRKL